MGKPKDGAVSGTKQLPVPKGRQVEPKTVGIGDRLNKETNRVLVVTENKADGLESVLYKRAEVSCMHKVVKTLQPTA